MEEFAYNYQLLIGLFIFFQMILTLWSFLKTRSYLLTGATLLMPFLGIPMIFYRLRESVKDNQVAGAVTYFCVIIGIGFFLWQYPEDEVPWMVILTMEFFAGLSVTNIINLSIDTGSNRNE